MKAIAGLFLAVCLMLPALAEAKVPRIGYLAITTPRAELEKGMLASAFVKGLRSRGWEPGKNIEILYRSAEDNYDRLPELARELVRERVDVIVTFGDGIDAALRASKRIPIVGVHVRLVRPGWASSHARPGGNVTGLQTSETGLEFQKGLAWLKEASPRITRVALLTQVQAEFADHIGFIMLEPRFVEPARQLGIEIFQVSFAAARDLRETIRSAARQGAQALLIDTHTIFGRRVTQEVTREEAERHGMLAFHFYLNAVTNGCLMAWGVDWRANYERLGAHFVDSILRGAKPRDIPIEHATHRKLHVNLKAAKAIGLELPTSLLLQADRVID